MDDNFVFEGWENDTATVESPIEETKQKTEAQKVVEDVLKEDDKTKEEKPTEDTDKKEEDKPEESFDFNFDSEDPVETIDGEVEDIPVDEAEEDTHTEVDYKSVVSFMKDKGVLEYELEEGEQLTNQVAEELFEDSIEDAAETRIQEIIQDLPDVVKNLVNFSRTGGDVQQFLGKLVQGNATSINENIDLESEDNQILVIKNRLKQDGYDDDFIDLNIQNLKDSNKLKSQSEKSLQVLTQRQQEVNKQEVENQRKLQVQAKERKRAFKKELSDFIDTSKEINSVKLTKKDKTGLASYISDDTVKLDNGRNITPMQSDLMEALKDKEKTVILAKLLKNGFDFKDIIKEGKTKAVKEVKNELQRTKTLTPKKTQPKKKKRLEDFF